MRSSLTVFVGVAIMLSSIGSAYAQESTSPTEPPPAPPPPSDEVVVAKAPCGLIHRPCSYPHLALAVEGGVSALNEGDPFAFNTGVATVGHNGPSWGFRAGVELTSWFAIDAHYIGMSNHGFGAAEPGGSVNMLTSAATGELRFTAPFRYVQPYIFTGVGVYSTSITGDASAKAASPMYGSTELGVPIGLGVGIPITGGISIGAELAYHRLFGEAFSDVEEIGGGDFTTMNAVVRARF